MRHTSRLRGLVYLALLSLTVVPQSIPAVSADNTGYFRKVRAIKTYERGAPNPAGLAFSPDANAFLVLQAGGTDRVALMSSFWDPLGSVSLGTGVPDSINVAWDGKVGRLLLLGTGRDELIEVALGPGALPHSSTITRARVPWSWPRSARGMTVDPATGTIFVLDGAARRVIRIAPDPLPGLDREASLRRGRISSLGLAGLGSADLRGIAFNPSNSHLYVFDVSAQKLLELTQTGQVIATRDLSHSDDFTLIDPQGMVFAPSGDQTDDPTGMTLYIADSRVGDPWGRSGQVLELSLTEPALVSALTVQPTLVRTIDTAAWSMPSPDPMDITYLPTSNRLLVTDSEVEESPQVYWQGVNLFEATLSGTLVKTETTFTSNPTGLTPSNFSSEPAGVAYNSLNGHWFFSDDDSGKVFEVDLVDGVYGNSDDRVTSFSCSSCGDGDCESVAVDTGRGHLILADGVGSEVFDIAPGPNGRFDGCTSPGDDLATQFDTSILGIADPEGVEYNPDNGHLFITGHGATTVVETTITGSLLTVYDVGFLNALNLSGLAYAPSSVNPAVKNLYISARGVDNDSNPNENDGKIYEITLGVATCGNGVREASEQCDGADLGGATCASQSCTGGTPSCTSACTLSYSSCTGCPVCGNGVRETGEVCDGNDLGGQTCQSQGFSSGTLGCLSNCSGFNTSACVNPTTVEVRVAVGPDDAEESALGSVSLSSSDLELVFDGSNQTVGMLFTGVPIARGTQISNAYIQFKVDEVQTEITQLNIQGQAADNPATTFTTTPGNISSRPRTAASVSWSPVFWNTVGEVGLNQRTPNLAPILQEIVNGSNWTSGSSLVLIISGTGHRTAKSFEGEAAGAPLLHVELVSAVCGNGIREGGEACDGLDPGSGTCAAQNCTGGTPTCTPACTLDFSTCTGCPFCGNGVREAGEQCDGLDLGSGTCAAQNCTGGTPTCTPACTLDFSTCIGCPVCGNGIRETGEVCDGSDVGVETCLSQGFGSGTLQCLSNCAGFDTSGCSVCDLDGACDVGEDCQTCPNECTNCGPGDSIFADGFESGDFSAWSASTTDGGDLSTSAAAAIAGTYGLQALLDDNIAIYLTDNGPSAETRYRARFYFDPNSIAMASGDAHYILQGLTGTATVVVQLEFRSFQGDYQIRGALLNDLGALTSTAWVTLRDEVHFLELDWRAATAAAANNGGLTLWVDGQQQADVSGIDNDTRVVDFVRLGAVSGIDTATRGTYFFDAYESRRNTYIGPDSGVPPPPPLPTPPEAIFADSFESGSLSTWSVSTTDLGDLSPSVAAAIAGAYGLEAVLDDNNSIYLTDWSPFAEKRYRASFYFDPNTIAMGNGNAHYIFQGLTGTSTAVVRIEFRFKSSSYQLRAALLNDAGSWVSSAWAIVSDAPHLIAMDWIAATAAGANNGSLTLKLDGLQVGSLVGFDNDTRVVDFARLGAVSGIDVSTRGTYYLDAFDSRRIP